MNDLKRITHEMAMKYAIEHSENSKDFVGEYIVTTEAIANRISEVDANSKPMKSIMINTF